MAVVKWGKIVHFCSECEDVIERCDQCGEYFFTEELITCKREQHYHSELKCDMPLFNG